MRDLQSFVAEHERKLEHKIAVIAENRASITRNSLAGEETRALDPTRYRAILGHRFTKKVSTHTWPLSYELLRRE